MKNEDIGLVIEQPLSIREQVYKRISDLILTGQIAPSERIIENKLAIQLGVSRTPIREALHVLEMEGFLEAIPRIGYQVKAIHWDEAVEICEIRKVNETLAALWALEKITDKELTALKDNLDAAEVEVKKGNFPGFITLDADFHEILVRASGSQRLVEICQTLRRHMLRYRIESIYHETIAMRALEGHRRIYQRVKEHDAEQVVKVIHDHLEIVKKDIRQYVFEKEKI